VKSFGRFTKYRLEREYRKIEKKEDLKGEKKRKL